MHRVSSSNEISYTSGIYARFKINTKKFDLRIHLMSMTTDDLTQNDTFILENTTYV
jgi:hypothetical protein